VEHATIKNEDSKPYFEYLSHLEWIEHSNKYKTWTV